LSRRVGCILLVCCWLYRHPFQGSYHSSTHLPCPRTNILHKSTTSSQPFTKSFRALGQGFLAPVMYMYIRDLRCTIYETAQASREPELSKNILFHSLMMSIEIKAENRTNSNNNTLIQIQDKCRNKATRTVNSDKGHLYVLAELYLEDAATIRDLMVSRVSEDVPCSSESRLRALFPGCSSIHEYYYETSTNTTTRELQNEDQPVSHILTSHYAHFFT
jgi:hypothetical protein